MTPSPNVRLTDRDFRMLGFLGEHRLVLERQVGALLGVGQEPLRKRLGRLADAGYLARAQIFDASCCRIRRRGLAAIGSSLGPPKLKLSEYRHDIGAAWLWLVAWRGAFGQVADVIGERRLRWYDTKTPDGPYSIRLGGIDAHGHLQRHYPDLVLVNDQGRRLALELELSAKEMARWETILSGYGADRRLDGVIYLVEATRRGRAIGRSIASAAMEMGLTDRVSVRTVTPIGLRAPGTEPGPPVRRRTRTAAEAAR